MDAARPVVVAPAEPWWLHHGVVRTRTGLLPVGTEVDVTTPGGTRRGVVTATCVRLVDGTADQRITAAIVVSSVTASWAGVTGPGTLEPGGPIVWDR